MSQHLRNGSMVASFRLPPLGAAVDDAAAGLKPKKAAGAGGNGKRQPLAVGEESPPSPTGPPAVPRCAVRRRGV